MTPRYRHFISPAKEGRWPTTILCVDCVSTSDRANDSGTMQVERLASWHAVMLSAALGGQRYDRSTAGMTTDGFWDMVKALSDEDPNLWLISYQCNRVWGLLDLWRMLEDGRVTVCDTDYRNREAERDRLRQYRRGLPRPLRTIGGSESRRIATQNSGYMVCEDPPNILRGRVYGSRSPCQWVDVRNYGVDAPDGVNPGLQTAEWIAALMKRMVHVCKESGLTGLKATAGSQAVAAWRHSHLTESVYVHTDERATKLEMEAYCGGRCEATRIGVVKCPVYHVDFRSQYGWVQSCCALPTRIVDYFKGVNPGRGGPGSDYGNLIADVDIVTDEPAYPLKREDVVIYPVGRFRTTLCGPELQDAVRHGRVIRFHKWAMYEMGYPLKSYADAMYALRCQEELDGVEGSATWIKRLIVGLPGKLGQRNHRWVDTPDVMPNALNNALYGEWIDEEGERYRVIGGIVQRDCVDGFAADSVPAIAAFVTSWGRVRLLSAIRSAGRENVHYYDTDSLFVNAEGFARLKESEFMVSSGMGFLTLRSVPTYCEIRGVKYYVEDKKVTCSGLVRGNVADMGDGMHYARYLSAAEQSRKGMRPEPIVVHGTYHRGEEYRQGTVRPDGRVVPFCLNDH